jgi:tRNA-dihydrouridine synthase B
MIKEKSLFLAPMEGVTEPHYRALIQKLYPEWDYMACDFLRLPSGGKYPKKHIIKHFGREQYEDQNVRNKTIYQVLAAPNSKIEPAMQDLAELEFPWVDLNLGCPSSTVCKRFGGSFLLSDRKLLRPIIQKMRKHFPNRLTVKIRVGFKDDTQFIDNLKMFEDEGVEAITIHGRTREQLYKGRANWGYIKKAVETVKVPVIGNGDIWSIEDIDSIFEYTGCHSVMIARGAMKTPWLARDYKNQESSARVHMMKNYFSHYINVLENQWPREKIHKRFKGLSRYIFDDLDNGPELKTQFLRSKTLDNFLYQLNQL